MGLNQKGASAFFSSFDSSLGICAMVDIHESIGVEACETDTDKSKDGNELILTFRD